MSSVILDSVEMIKVKQSEGGPYRDCHFVCSFDDMTAFQFSVSCGTTKQNLINALHDAAYELQGPSV